MTGLLSRARSMNGIRVWIENVLIDMNDRPVEQSSVNESRLSSNQAVLLDFNDRPVEQSSAIESN